MCHELGVDELGVERPAGADEAEPGVELVDFAVGVHARVVFSTRVPSKSDVSPVSPVRV